MRYCSQTDRQKMIVTIEVAQQIQSEVAADASRDELNANAIKADWKRKGFYASMVNQTVNDAVKELEKTFA